MKKVFVVVSAMMFASSAYAETKTYTINDLFTLANGLGTINNGFSKIVKDGGKESIVPEQFDFTSNVKIVLAKNLVRVTNVLEPIQKEAKAVRETLCKKTNCSKPEEIEVLNKEMEKLTDKSVPVDLIELTENDLNLSVNKEISPVVLRQLKPILPFLK